VRDISYKPRRQKFKDRLTRREKGEVTNPKHDRFDAITGEQVYSAKVIWRPAKTRVVTDVLGNETVVVVEEETNTLEIRPVGEFNHVFLRRLDNSVRASVRWVNGDPWVGTHEKLKQSLEEVFPEVNEWTL
jgi:hypothetical protein